MLIKLAMYGSISVLLVFVVFLSSCRLRAEKEIDLQRIAMLKKKYSVAGFNYFYETVFHEDEAVEKRENLHKWKSNPQIVINGNPSTEEIGYVRDAINRINRMKLPVKCELNSKANSDVLEIYFEDFENAGKHMGADSMASHNADPDRHLAIARATSQDGIINGAHVSIFYNPKDTDPSVRRNIVLEEIIQSLGVTGDSYTYPGSLFFQNYNPSKTFTPLDSNVLSLLYEDAIPFNYPRESFESDFGDLLYHVDVKEKLVNLLRKSPAEFLSDGDPEACFIENELLKHPKEVTVILEGSVEKDDSVTLKEAIKSINKLSPNLSITLARPRDVAPEYGIVFDLIRVENQTEPIKRTIKVLKGKDCMFPKLIKSNIALSFNMSEKARKFRQQSIVDALYFSLIQLPQGRLQGKKLADIGQESVRLDQHYADLITLIYSDEFVDGLRLGEFEKIKSSLAK